jgi:serine/threonine-protein kinase
MQFIPGMGLDAVLEELRRLRRGAGSAGPPGGRARSNGAVSAAEVAEAILTGRFSLADGVNGALRPGTTLADTSSGPLVHPGTVSRQPGDSSVVSLPGASADSLARSDPDRTFFRSVARIGLLVAEALEYANRQGVLHRDVKPSNLLLDPKGNVWVADFGLAKSADGEDLTHSGDIVGTVRYMAPERFAGKCDARSDVYALGLTLYELLALRPAFSAADRHELMRRVMSEGPKRLRALVPNLPRDLETIVEKAIFREPAERYTSAAALAEDLQRFLDDRPIKARRIGHVEQAWRLARRNKLVSSLATSLLLTLVGGLAGVMWQWRQAVANLAAAESANGKAQSRFGLAMDAVQAFTAGASEDVLLREKQLEGLRKKLLDGSLNFYERLTVSLEGETDRTSRRALARAVFDAAELNGRIGRSEKALEAHRRALALRVALANETPGDVESRRDVGRSELAVGETLAVMGRHDEARQAFARSRAVAEARLFDRPDDAEARTLKADGTAAEGRLLFDEQRFSNAGPILERAQAIYDGLVRDALTEDTAERYRRGRAKSAFELGRLGNWYGRWPGALAALEQATADYEELTRQSPGDLDLWLALATCHRETANCLINIVDNSLPSARRHYRRANAIYERLGRKNPTAMNIRVEWAWCMNDESSQTLPHATLEQIEGQLRKLELSIAIARELVAADPDVPRYLATLGPALMTYGQWLSEAGRREEGLAYLKEACEVLERRDFTGSFSYQQGRRLQLRARLVLAVLLARAGRAGDALETVRKAEAMSDAYTGTREIYDYASATARIHLLHTYLAFGAGKPDEAATASERAAALLEPLSVPSAQETWDLGALHVIRYMQGRPTAPGRPGEPPGRPEHAERALALVRRAAERGYIDSGTTAAFFGPVLGHLPEFRSMMEDFKFPADPFGPEDAEEAVHDGLP